MKIIHNPRPIDTEFKNASDTTANIVTNARTPSTMGLTG